MAVILVIWAGLDDFLKLIPDQRPAPPAPPSE